MSEPSQFTFKGSSADTEKITRSAPCRGIPFIDLTATAAEVWAKIQPRYMHALLRAQYVGGPAVASFERLWAAYCGARYAIGVANGTDALELALTGLDIGHGDEVVVPAITFVATAEAVARVGAVPRFADVDADTLLITPETLRAAITRRTRAVVVVHLYGQMPDMTKLLATARSEGIIVIEDAAQAHGAEWQGRRAGSFGIVACFSFYPSKNLGAFGDAGAVVTSDSDLAEKIRELANHGRPNLAHFNHRYIGRNSRLDDLQAIVLEGALSLLEGWTERRIELARQYAQRLHVEGGLMMVTSAEAARHVYHLLVVRVPGRDEVRRLLMERNIQTSIHYPTPCHLQPPFQKFASERLPVSELAAAEILSLPLFPHMTRCQVDDVCDNLLDIIRSLMIEGPTYGFPGRLCGARYGKTGLSKLTGMCSLLVRCRCC
jgi:dTDP-4-amino-4,6-dideoxygalactose transaminase